MKRIVLWALSTLSAVVLLFGYHTSTSATRATTAPISVVSGNQSAGSSSSGGSSSGASTVTGSVAQTRWGPVQVRLTLSGSRITAVDVVQYPSANPNDQRINAYALPILVQETLSRQSARIDMVSGATVTSDGYLQSLQSALDQAGS